MSNSVDDIFTSEDAKNVLLNGKLYYPASDHHIDKFKDANLINVCCDYCNTSMLKISIGFNDKDICLPCAELIANNKGVKSLAEAVDHFQPYNSCDNSYMLHPQFDNHNEKQHYYALIDNDYVCTNDNTNVDTHVFNKQNNVRKNGFSIKDMFNYSARKNPVGLTRMTQDSVRRK